VALAGHADEATSNKGRRADCRGTTKRPTTARAHPRARKRRLLRSFGRQGRWRVCAMEEAGSRVAESVFEFAVGQVSRNRPALALE
jgi:hypothetical protein